MNQTDNPNTDSNRGNLTLDQLVDDFRETASQGTNPEIQWLELKSGDVLFAEGDESDSMYLVIAGMMGVRLKQPG